MYRMKWNKERYTLIQRIIKNLTIYAFTYSTSMKQGT